MYMDHLAGRYTRGFVLSEGINCTGLINWARAECGLPTIGGTKRYPEWLEENGNLERYDPNVPGLVFRHEGFGSYDDSSTISG